MRARMGWKANTTLNPNRGAYLCTVESGSCSLPGGVLIEYVIERWGLPPIETGWLLPSPR